MLRLYIIGICILLVAIIANILVKEIGIITWYDFGYQIIKKGFKSVQDLSFLSIFWLFILYPLILSLGYLIGNSIYKLF